MRIILDQHLSHEIAEILRQRSLDAEAVAQRSDLIGAPDERIVEVAAVEGQAVVTNNVKDFRPICARRLVEGRGHGGLILVPASRSRTRAAVGALADALEAIMRANEHGIEDREIWIPPLE